MIYSLEKRPYSLPVLASTQYATASTNGTPRVFNNRLEIMKLQLQDCADVWNRQYADNAIFSCNNYPEHPESLQSQVIQERHNSQMYGTMFRSAARAATVMTAGSNPTSLSPRTPNPDVPDKKTLAASDSSKPLLDFPSEPGEGVATAKAVGSWLSFAVLGLGVML